MDVSKIVNFLWNLLNKNKSKAANITAKENEIIVNILTGKKWSQYKASSQEAMISTLKNV